MPKRSHASDDSEEEPQEESRSNSPQTKKQKYVEFEPVRICSIESVKEINQRVLRAQYYKLCERFRYKQKVQEDLEKRIEEFERRQVQDDAVNCIINRYWNMLDGDIQLLLQRFDENPQADLKEENPVQDQHFLSLLAQWSCEELDEKFKQRIEFSQRTLTKLLQSCNQISGKNIQICNLLKAGSAKFPANSENSPPEDENQPGDEDRPKIDDQLRAYSITVLEENKRLQKLANQLQTENHNFKLQKSARDDKIAQAESRSELMRNEIEDLRYQLAKSQRREEKLDFRLAELVKKENSLRVQAIKQKDQSDAKNNDNGGDGGGQEEMARLSKTKLEEMQQDLEVQTELANNRLVELQEVTERNKTLSAELESCKMKLKYIAPEDIKNTAEYRCLQATFSLLFEDSKLLKKEIEDLKQQNGQIRQLYEEQINSIKSDEATSLERLKQTVLELDNDLNTARREYENVCVDYEMTTTTREQAAPIQEQINSLMSSLSSQNTQLKQEVARLKRKCQEALDQLATCQKELEDERRLNNDNYLIIKLDEQHQPPPATNTRPSHSHSFGRNTPSPNTSDKANGIGSMEIKKEVMDHPSTSHNGQDEFKPVIGRPDSSSNPASSRPSTPADMADAQAVIQRLRMERDRLREKLRQMAREDLAEKKKHWAEEQKRKQKQLEEQCEKLRREVHSARQEEGGLMQELETTGQAFDELQEQQKKLLEQLGEKEEVNLKMMSERIKSTQAHKKMKDEKELYLQTIASLENQLAAKMLCCQKLEEKERVLNEHRHTLEHELRIREQNNDALKKKATEYAQLSADLRLRLDRLDVQFNELRENVIKKASTHEADANKIKRLEEEKSSLKRKLDRAKKMEKFENIDEVLQEENRLLRESMTCPSCKNRKKNAILSKCNHVFCFECIRQRYDNRRRKCPKCNAAFGANDYHRIYLDL